MYRYLRWPFAGLPGRTRTRRQPQTRQIITGPNDSYCQQCPGHIRARLKKIDALGVRTLLDVPLITHSQNSLINLVQLHPLRRRRAQENDFGQSAGAAPIETNGESFEGFDRRHDFALAPFGGISVDLPIRNPEELAQLVSSRWGSSSGL